MIVKRLGCDGSECDVGVSIEYCDFKCYSTEVPKPVSFAVDAQCMFEEG